jgi:hypothetical protein
MKLIFGSVINALADRCFRGHFLVLRKDLAYFRRRNRAISPLKATGSVLYHLLIELHGLLANVERS